MERPEFIEDYLLGKPITQEQQQRIKPYSVDLSDKVHQSDHVSMKWGVLRGVTNIVHDTLRSYHAVLRNQRVIELGPGGNPLAKFV